MRTLILYNVCRRKDIESTLDSSSFRRKYCAKRGKLRKLDVKDDLDVGSNLNR